RTSSHRLGLENTWLPSTLPLFRHVARLGVHCVDECGFRVGQGISGYLRVGARPAVPGWTGRSVGPSSETVSPAYHVCMLQASTPALILAPMEGVTDAPMRAVQGMGGAFTFAVSEFLRVAHAVLPRAAILRHVPELRSGGRTPTGLPVQVQL